MDTVTKRFGLLGGKKLVCFVLTMLIIAFRTKLQISDADIQLVVYLAMTFIGGQSLADGLSQGKTSSVVQVASAGNVEAAAKAAVMQQIKNSLERMSAPQEKEAS